MYDYTITLKFWWSISFDLFLYLFIFDLILSNSNADLRMTSQSTMYLVENVLHHFQLSSMLWFILLLISIIYLSWEYTCQSMSLSLLSKETLDVLWQYIYSGGLRNKNARRGSLNSAITAIFAASKLCEFQNLVFWHKW